MPIEINHCVSSCFGWIHSGPAVRKLFLQPIYLSMLIVALTVLILYLTGNAISSCNLPRTVVYLLISTYACLITHISMRTFDDEKMRKEKEGSSLIDSITQRKSVSDGISISPNLSSAEEVPNVQGGNEPVDKLSDFVDDIHRTLSSQKKEDEKAGEDSEDSDAETISKFFQNRKVDV